MSDTLDKFAAVPTAQKVILLVLIMVGIGAAWYFLMYEEVQGKISREVSQVQGLNKELADEQELARNLDKFRAEIQELKRQRDEMRARLPDNAEIADLLQQIHSQAKIVGLEISRFERANTERESLYARIPVKMKLTGNFQQVTSFFYSLGQLKRIVNVENIELTSKRTTNNVDEDRLETTCVATTFQYLPPVKAPPKKKKFLKKKKKKKGGH